MMTYPFFAQAVQFYQHPESMVRAAVRAITLNIFQVGLRWSKIFTRLIQTCGMDKQAQ